MSGLVEQLEIPVPADPAVLRFVKMWVTGTFLGLFLMTTGLFTPDFVKIM
jgi:hypothetical protein